MITDEDKENYKEIFNKVSQCTLEWEIQVDGSAYFGQMNKDDEKHGMGKEISIYGRFKYGIFIEDEFIKGFIVNQDGTYFKFNSEHRLNKGLMSLEEYCFTEVYFYNNSNWYEGMLKNGSPQGLGTLVLKDPGESPLAPESSCSFITTNFEEGEPRGIAKFYALRCEKKELKGIIEENEVNPDASLLKLVCKAVVSKSFKIELVLMAFFNGRTVFMNTKINPFSRNQKLIVNYENLIEHNKNIDVTTVCNRNQ